MKVIQLIDTLRSGGAERMAVNMAEVMNREGIVNQLVVSREEGMQINRIGKTTQIHFLGKRSFFDFKALLNLFKIVKAFQPDIIHAHSTSIFWGVFAKLNYSSAKIIWHDHYGLSDQLKPKDRFPERFLTKWIDGIIVVNEKLRDWLIKSTTFPNQKITLIPNFPFLKETISEKLGLGQTINIIHLANFRRQKDHITLLTAFSNLCEKDTYNNYKLVLAGNTNLDQDYSLEINNFIKEKKITDKVDIKGEVENVEDLLNNAHIGVLTSNSEGLPVSLLEYALAGLPVLVTNVGDCSEVLKQGDLGLIVPVGNHKKVTEGLLEIVKTYNQKLIQAKLLKSRVEEQYGAINFINQYKLFVNRI